MASSTTRPKVRLVRRVGQQDRTAAEVRRDLGAQPILVRKGLREPGADRILLEVTESDVHGGAPLTAEATLTTDVAAETQ